MKIDFQDKIDDYLLGRMTDGERSSFEQQMNQDEELKEQVEFTRNVMTATKSRNEKLRKMEAWGDDYQWQHKRRVAAAQYRPTGSGYEATASAGMVTRSAPTQSSRKWIYWVSGIAALFVVGFFLTQTMFVSKSPRMVKQQGAFGSDYTDTFRGGTSFSEIEELIEKRNFTEALAQIEQKRIYLDKETEELSAISNAERREYDALLIKNKQDDLKWLKIYALIGLNRKAEAIMLLEELRSTDGSYRMAADSLYNSLKR